MFKHINNILKNEELYCLNGKCKNVVKKIFEAKCKAVDVDVNMNPAKPTESLQSIKKKMDNLECPVRRRNTRHKAFETCANIYCSKAGGDGLEMHLKWQMEGFTKELKSVRGLCMACCILTGHVEGRKRSYIKWCKIHGLSAKIVRPGDRED